MWRADQPGGDDGFGQERAEAACGRSEHPRAVGEVEGEETMSDTPRTDAEAWRDLARDLAAELGDNLAPGIESPALDRLAVMESALIDKCRGFVTGAMEKGTP